VPCPTHSGRVTDGWVLSSPGPTCGDHPRGVFVRVERHSARCAEKFLPVTDAPLEALVAGLARVGRIYLNDPDPLRRCFVPDELPELEEAPQAHHPVQVLRGNPEMPADALEVLQGDPVAAGLDGLPHNGLGNPVVDPGRMAPLTSREPFQGAFGTLRAFGLETGAYAKPVFPVFTNVLAEKLPSRGRHGDVSDAEVDAQDAAQSGILDFALNDDIGPEAVLGMHEHGRLDVPGSQSGPLVMADVKGRAAAALVSRERNLPGLEDQTERPCIEGDECGPVFEPALEVRGFESASRPAESGHGEVSREEEILADLLVERPMETEGVGLLMVPAPLGDVGTGLGVELEEIRKERFEILGDLEFASDGLDALHDGMLPQEVTEVKDDMALSCWHRSNNERGFLRRLKAAVSAANLL